MKLFLVILSFGLISCSTSKEIKSLSQRIQAEEVRSLEEIKSHAEYLLKSHPELDEKTKIEVTTLLDHTIKKQQALKDEESKIFQLLLSKSLRVKQLTNKEVDDKNKFKMRLKDVYNEKSKNVLLLIDKIVVLSERNTLNESFKNDMMEFMRDFR